MSHHNTTNENPQTLKALESRAIRQEDVMLHVFKLCQGELTPFEAAEWAERHKKSLCEQDGTHYVRSPLTSWRRAITNLTVEGKLEKTNNRKEEKYGMKNYTWRLSLEGAPGLQVSLF